MQKQFLLLFFLCACAHRQERFHLEIAHAHCEQAQEIIPELQPLARAASSSEWTAKNILAYSYIGVNYTAEVLWDASVGTVIAIGLCAPVIALAATTNAKIYSTVPSTDQALTQKSIPMCFPWPKSAKNLLSPPLGRTALKQTQEFRCPDVDDLFLSLEKIALCFQSRQSPDDLAKALKTIEAAESSPLFRCSSEGVRARLVALREELIAHL